jgi:Periplasmic protein involved in polysaccharide export
MKIKFALLALTSILFFACQSVPKDISYFQDFEQIKNKQIADFYKYEPTIKNNDQLIISVSAPVLDQTQVAQFNLPMNTYLAQGESVLANSGAMQTYTVNKDGYVNFPVIGKIKLQGLTRSQAVDLLESKISPYLPDPIINLQFVSFRVTVLGEVNRPGTIEIKDEHISVLEAIGQAGDLTVYGNRKNIKVIRDNNGIQEFYEFDLTKSEVFTSPYYYLQQNDVVYIEPNDTKKKGSKFGAGENYTISVLSLTFSALSIVTSVLGILLK